jgi:hypothetical protein
MAKKAGGRGKETSKEERAAFFDVLDKTSELTRAEQGELLGIKEVTVRTRMRRWDDPRPLDRGLWDSVDNPIDDFEDGENEYDQQDEGVSNDGRGALSVDVSVGEFREIVASVGEETGEALLRQVIEDGGEARE